jgi:hydrogenase maturation protein HypF
MCPDAAAASVFAEISGPEKALLASPAAPIVLLKKREAGRLSRWIAPGLDEIGIMLPYTPLHHLMLRGHFQALVMTSGNLRDEPTIAGNGTALEKLGGICDYFLVHNREILIQNDDSIVKWIAGRPTVLRRARGYVPAPLPAASAPEVSAQPDILAVGAEEKGTFCLVKGSNFFLSQHLGDLKNRAAVLSFENTASHMKNLLNIKPGIVVHDAHPGYWSSGYARKLPAREKMAVQHHHAHIASCMAEHRETGPVIGVSFDGFGYGTDGAAWGGEFLVADLFDFRRAGRLDYVALPGGDAAAREPCRMAAAYLYHAFGPAGRDVARRLMKNLPEEKMNRIFELLQKNIRCFPTSSMGRLFDAAAALTGTCHVNTFEGQAPMMLESLIADAAPEDAPYPLGIREDSGMQVVGLKKMIRALVEDIEAGRPAGRISRRFHDTVCQIALAVCTVLGRKEGIGKVALSGGVFQNRYVTEKLVKALSAAGFEVLTQVRVPPNDGGISIGQAAVAAARLQKRRN